MLSVHPLGQVYGSSGLSIEEIYGIKGVTESELPARLELREVPRKRNQGGVRGGMSAAR